VDEKGIKHPTVSKKRKNPEESELFQPLKQKAKRTHQKDMNGGYQEQE